MAYERFTEPRVTIEWLLAKRNSLTNLPAFLGPYGIYSHKLRFSLEMELLSSKLNNCLENWITVSKIEVFGQKLNFYSKIKLLHLKAKFCLVNFYLELSVLPRKFCFVSLVVSKKESCPRKWDCLKTWSFGSEMKFFVYKAGKNVCLTN